MSGASYVVYVLRCADGTYYTGITNDLTRRLRLHNQGRGARYTAGRRPIRCVYQECVSGRSAALRRECAIKRMSRRDKHALIAEGAVR
jgi:putative endonuclease